MDFKKIGALNRKHKILKTIWDLGGIDRGVTTKEIAMKTRLNINGLSQGLGRMYFSVDCLGGKGRERKWKLKNRFVATLT